MISWKPPLDGWICLNSDGSVQGESMNAGCGGIFRDAAGR